jgi:hypothetical protein
MRVAIVSTNDREGDCSFMRIQPKGNVIKISSMDAFERVLMTIITTLNVFRIFLASAVDETVAIMSV